MLILLLLILIILLIISYYFCQRDVLSPSVLSCIVLIISISFAVANIKYWGINYSSKTFIIMLVGIISFVLPGYFFNTKKVVNDNLSDKYFKKSNVIVPDKKIIFVFLIFDLIITYFYLKEVYRISLIGGNNLGIWGMASYFRNYTAMNYDSEQISTFLSQLLKISRALGFVSIFILSYNSQIEKDKKRDKSLWLFVIIAIIQNIFGGGRGVMLWLAGMAFATTYICNMSKYGWHKIINFKYIKLGIRIFAIILVIFYVLKYFVRIGNSTDTFLDYISYYIGGSIENFNLYIDNPP